ncbi:MAG TPA: PhnD/SsuA/transferrin family substrate-binding protein [Noviherbaspirillum sp.]|nr:PhnD/SsuA/transferrin family substrate-binding protein [Noviherbaspirillum sp.]
MDNSRRTFLKATAGLTMAGAGFGASSLTMAQAAGLKWASLAPGFTILITDYIVEKGLDKKYGVNLGKPTEYTSVSTYYNDFVAGQYDVCVGTWDTFAARYLAGVPMRFVCAISTGNMINIVVPGNGATTLKALEGKTVAAPQSTGTYRLTKAIIKELTGTDLETSMRVQNVDNPAAAVTLVMANRADAALSWEPNITSAITKVPDMRVLYNTGDEFRKKVGLDLPYFGVGVRAEALARDPSLPGKLDKVFAECVTGILGNVDEAVKLAATSGIPANVLKAAIASNRMQLKHLSMADPKGREAVKTAADLLHKNAVLPRALDDKFFAA